MSIAGLYVVYDEVAEVHTAPITLKNDAVAKRWFAERMSKVNDPTDFKLYLIGQYDEDTGIIQAITEKILIDTGHKIEEAGE